jgi:hypothetical protein
MKLRKSSEQREMARVTVIKDHWKHLLKALPVVALDLARSEKPTRTMLRPARRQRQPHHLREVVQKMTMTMRTTTQIDDLSGMPWLDIDPRKSLICLFLCLLMISRQRCFLRAFAFPSTSSATWVIDFA